jgi:hypothetical protein
MDTLTALLQAGALRQTVFTTESRYVGLPIATFTKPDGSELRYVGRRFIPPPESFATLHLYRVLQNDRIDVIAARIYGEPLYYWRICDAFVALRPEDVTAVTGTYIRIPVPAATPGGS